MKYLIKQDSLLGGVSAAAVLWRYTLYSALIKISLRNAGSKLGLLWELLSTMIVSLILAVVWIKVLGLKDPFYDYFLYVYVGMIVWGCLAGAVSNLCATLVKNANHITARSLPIFSYIFEDILISFMPFLMSLPVVIAIVLLSGYPLTLFSFLSLMFGIVLVLIAAFAFSISVGLSAFFIGDIRQMITSIMRLSFLVTPVIWKPERLGDAQYLLLLNPFYGYLHILRNSFTGEPIEMQYALQACGVTVAMLLVGSVMFVQLKNKIQARALVL